MQAGSTGVPAARTNIPEQGKKAHLRWTSLEYSSRKQSLKYCQSKFESPLNPASRLFLQRLCKRLPMLLYKKGCVGTQDNQTADVMKQLDSLLVLLYSPSKIKAFMCRKRRKKRQKSVVVGSNLQLPSRKGEEGECSLSCQLSLNGACGALMLQNPPHPCNKFVLLKIINLES